MLTTVDCSLDLKLAVGVGPGVPDAANLSLTLQYAVFDALLCTLVPGQDAAHACANDGYASVFHGSTSRTLGLNVVSHALFATLPRKKRESWGQGLCMSYISSHMCC